MILLFSKNVKVFWQIYKIFDYSTLNILEFDIEFDCVLVILELKSGLEILDEIVLLLEDWFLSFDVSIVVLLEFMLDVILELGFDMLLSLRFDEEFILFKLLDLFEPKIN